MAKRPKAVTEAAERAEELHRQMYSRQSEAAESETGAEDGAEPVEDATSEPSAEESVKTQPEQPEQPVTQSNKEEDWQQKYRSLQGMYNAEVPRLKRTVAEQANMLQRLEEQLAQLQKSKDEEEESDEEFFLASDEEKEEYGPDFVEFVERIAQRAAKHGLKNLQPKIKQIEGEVTESRQKATQGMVYAALDREVQNWRAVNRDPGFLQWLSAEEGFTGQTRKASLDRAFQSGNADVVVAIFKTYLNGAQPTQDTSEAQPRPGKKPLSDLAGPTRAAGSQAPTEPPAPKVWRTSEIQKFYEDARKGRLSKEAYRNKEASLAQALKDGRIQRDT